MSDLLPIKIENLLRSIDRLDATLQKSMEEVKANELKFASHKSFCVVTVQNFKDEIENIYSDMTRLVKSDRKIWEILNQRKGNLVVLGSICAFGAAITTTILGQLFSAFIRG